MNLSLNNNEMILDKKKDVIIIGGSYAGLSAAMSLARSLRKVLVIDSGSPCNQQTPHSHNFITQDGEKPAAIAAKAKAQVLTYETVEFVNELAVTVTKKEGGLIVRIQGGNEFEGKKIVLATGIKDVMPDIEGFDQCWGISVVHCPYCHGYELRNTKTAIMANGDKAFHLASLVNNLTDDITLLSSGKANFTSEQSAKLNKHNIRIIENEITAIEHHHGFVKNVVFNDGSKIPFEGVYAAIPFTQHTDIPASLGCELTAEGYLKVDAFQKTTVDGVYACGDNCGSMRSVAHAVYSGNFTGAIINKELTDEQF